MPDSVFSHFEGAASAAQGRAKGVMKCYQTMKGPLSLNTSPKDAEVDERMMAILVACAALFTVGVILKLVLDDVGVDSTICPYCASKIGGKPLACPQCHRALGKR